MGYTCNVPKGKTGYRSNKKNESKSAIPLFRFPSNSVLCQKWIRAIPRENLNVSDSCRICAKHFTESDIQTMTTSSRKIRESGDELVELKKVRLKPSAIPCIFPNLPKYLSKKTLFKRADSSSSSSRYKKESILLQEQEKKFKEQDAFQDLESLKIKIEKAILPSGYFKLLKDDAVEFYCISKSYTDISSAPKLIASIIITENLLTSAYVDSVYLAEKMYEHLLSSVSVSTLTEVSNMLAFCKNLSNKCLDDCVNKTVLVKMAVNALEQYLDTATKIRDKNNSFDLIQFLLEQLKLIHIDKGALRYSSDLLTVAFLWKLTSTCIVMQEASDAHSKTADSDTVSAYQVSSVQLVTDKKLEAFNKA